MKIYNDDCFNVFKTINDKIDLVLVDLPYGQIECEWDIKIDLDKMWIELKKIISDNCTLIFFCNTRFGYELIKSNERWFGYDLVWEKSQPVGHLDSKIRPLRKHEMLYIFQRPSCIDLDNSRHLDLREYAEKVDKYINISLRKIDEVIGNQGIHHFFSYRSTQFSLPIEKNYIKLVKEYKLDKMDGFLEYDDMKAKWKNRIYNPQLTKGKPYTRSKGAVEKRIYSEQKAYKTINKGTRYPTSILKFNNPMEGLHPTQKPVKLCEWLIKTYSNEKDLVLDFTMGSGTTGEACKNTNREFIGIEKDNKIFNIAKKRLKL